MTTPQNLGPTLRHLADTARRYQQAAAEYGPLLQAAAQAEADYKRDRAKLMLRCRDSGEVRSVAEAEMRADADDHVAGLLQQRLLTRAVADSHLEMLRQLRTQVEAVRSYVATEREADRHHAQGHTGAS